MQAHRVFHTRVPRRRRLRALIATGATALLALVVTVPAGAAPNNTEVTPYALGHTGHGVNVSGVTSFGPTWLGPVIGTADAEVAGWYSWCITIGYDAPNGAAAASIDYLDDPLLAWIMGTKESEARSDASGTAAAAISYGAKMRHETGTSSVSAAARRAALEANTPQSIKDKWGAYLAEAETQAGPHTAGAAEPAAARNLKTGSVTGIAQFSRSGTPVPGLRYTAEIYDYDPRTGALGPLSTTAWFDASGTSTYSGLTASQPIELTFTGDENGYHRVVVTYLDVVRTTLTKYGANGEIQDTLSYGGRGPADPVQLRAEGAPFEIVVDFRPIGTSSAPASVPAGSRLVDTFVPSAHQEDEWVVLDGKPVPVAYEVTVRDVGSTPVAESATAPAGEVVGSRVVVATQGEGVPIEVDLGESPGPSSYVYTWDTSEALQAATPETSAFVDYYRDGWSWTDGALHAETTIVRYPTEVTSSLSIRETINGVMLVDDQWVDTLRDAGRWAGIPPRWQGDTPTYTNSLFRVEGEVTAESCTPERQWGESVEVQATAGFKPSVGDLSWLIPHAELASAGGVTWVAQHSYSGDARTEAFVSPCDDVTQQFRVPEPGPEPLQVTTRAQSSSSLPVAGDGGTLSDVHVVTGTVPDGAKGRSTLFLDANGDGVFTPDEKVWTSGWVEYTTGPGEYQVPDAYAYGDRAGVYTFDQETVDVDGVRIAYEPPGHPEQTITVREPLTVTTKAQSSSETPTAGDGGTLTDVHLVTGTVPDGAKGRSTLFLDANGDGVFTPDEAVWTSGWVEYTAGPGEYQVPDAYAYGDRAGVYTFDQETVDVDGVRIAYEPPGHPDQTITVEDAEGSAPVLAVTGVQGAALAAAAGVLVLAGVGVVLWRRRLTSAAAGDPLDAP